MKINILDPAIFCRAGHHYDYGLKLVRHYAGEGHDVHVYGAATMNDEVAADFQEFGGVTKLFQALQYLTPDLYDWYAGEIIQYRRESASIAEDLRSVRQADVWIWPTLWAPQLEACATIGLDVPMVGCVFWDPGVESRSLEAMLWRSALESARERGVRFTIASVEAELRHRFMPIMTKARFALVPHPVDGPPIAEPKTALKRIGFFGHQRREKGLTLMQPLLSRLIGDGYSITFQNSDHDADVPKVAGVTMLDYVENIAVPIAECDLVVLPYDIKQYQARGSGILMECIALGVPVTAPIGTLPGRTVEQLAIGPLFVANSVRPIYQAIKAAERNYAVFAANAHVAARQFSNRNGVGRFAAALLAAAR